MTRSSATRRSRRWGSTRTRKKFEKAFFEDMDALGVERPEVHPACDREHPGDGDADRAVEREGDCVPGGGRQLVLPDRAVCRSTASFRRRTLRDGRRRAGGCGRVREGRGAGLCVVEGREDGSRTGCASRRGRRRWARGGRGGTSSARRWRRSSWARASTCTRAAKT